MSIQSVIDEVIKKEGGYVDNALDRGGKTNWGITEAVAREDGYTGDMKNLPRDRAVDIYIRKYVTKPKFSLIANVSPPVAEKLIDAGINLGPATPSKWLQRSLNVMNRRAKLWPDLVVDGAIGPATADALSKMIAHRGSEGVIVILRALNCLQGARYIEIAEKDETQEEFLYGWLKGRVS